MSRGGVCINLVRYISCMLFGIYRSYKRCRTVFSREFIINMIHPSRISRRDSISICPYIQKIITIFNPSSHISVISIPIFIIFISEFILSFTFNIGVSSVTTNHVRMSRSSMTSSIGF
mmetsp:Transcript_3664/g.338  ORF Transcript_3664/g.338 Transcript_3664/m.338 type:complete len:118 (-) Transcript_3664:134-487(-)